jgi:hypothetical protein
VNKEKCESLGINCHILDIGAILGTATLHDVKEYKNRIEFERDRNRHFADFKNFANYHYGFIIRSAKRFRKPFPYLGQLKFFEVVQLGRLSDLFAACISLTLQSFKTYLMMKEPILKAHIIQTKMLKGNYKPRIIIE